MNCYLVKDLLPNYIDGLVSEETKSDLQEHLNKCPKCQLLYEQMNAPLASSPVQNVAKEINFLKKIKSRTKKNIAIVAGVLIILFCILTWIFAIGTPADSTEVSVKTEFQRPGDYGLTTNDFDNVYLKQEWVVHFELTNGKALNAKTEFTYEENSNGDKITTGCIITLYEVQPSFLFECDNFTMGYSYEGSETPSSDFDYTIIVRYKDKDVVYSMRDEGLF